MIPEKNQSENVSNIELPKNTMLSDAELDKVAGGVNSAQTGYNPPEKLASEVSTIR